MPDKGRVSEIFSSLQGEGIYWGKKQIFVRFFGCNMKCVYCDEEEKTFFGPYEEMDAQTLRQKVGALEESEGPHHSISLTGGEPLLYVDFLKHLAPLLKRDGFLLYLETNGTYPGRLKEILDWIDIIAMDIKPPSSTRDRAFWPEHREFLEIGRRKGIFVKIVVTPETSSEEVERAASEVARVDQKIPFILQPVTPHGLLGETIAKVSLFQFEERAKRVLDDVRVIPQLHKFAGVP